MLPSKPNLFACAIAQFTALTIALLLGAQSFAADPSASAGGIELRKMLKELTLSSAGDASPARADAMRQVFASHPEILKRIASGQSLDVLLAEAGLSDFTDSFLRGHSLDQFVQESFKKVLSAPTSLAYPELQTLIPGLTEKAYEKFKDGSFGKLLSSPDLHLSTQNRVAILKQIAPDSIFERLATQLNQSIDKIDLGSSHAMQTLLESDLIQTLKTEDKALATGLLKRYFTLLPLADKRLILINLLDLSPAATKIEQLSSILQASGPTIQKVFQLIGRDTTAPEMREILTRLQDQIMPFSGAEARQIIERELGAPISSVFSEFNETPIAAATTGQVHPANLRSTGEKIAIKVLRPSIKERMLTEKRVIQDIFENTPSAPMVDLLFEQVLSELDYRNEYALTVKGEIYEDPKNGITTIKAIREVGPKEKIMVTTFASGQKISKFTSKDDLLLRGKAVRTLLEKWFDIALFEKGFFHGDLHPGNVYFEKKSSLPGYLVTLLDFGNAGALSVRQRQGFMKLLLGSMLKVPDTVADAFGELGELAPSDRATVLNELKVLFSKKLNRNQYVNQALAIAMQNNTKLPPQITAFHRGKLFLEKELEDINRQLNVLDPGKALGRFESAKVYAKVALRHIRQDLPAQLVGMLDKEDAVLSWQLIGDVLRDYTKKILGKIWPCQNLLLPSQP